MGISGLLPLLKSIHKTCHLKNFEGKTLGVDAYGWLHRGAVACAMELATDKPTRKFVDFAMHRVRMLQHFGVIPYLVFDGDNLPSKAETEARRAKKRQESKKAGVGLLKAGKVSQAYAEFQKSLDITPEMASQLIDELRISGVQYIVAPYEADSQMVYLENKGIINGIISEDSDLLVFGAKCLLTKLDQYGNCTEINKADFSACRDINLAGWSDTSFRQMAILSGCDYLASINNMGLKTAYRMIRKYKNIEKVIQILQFDGKFHVPKGYLDSFYKAELTFLHQRVYCPFTLGLVLCNQPSNSINLEDMPYIGAYVEPEIAQGIAKGDLHPMTKVPISLTNSAGTSFQRNTWTTSLSKRQSIEIIKGTPITSFFKKRTPLVELDPNSFTPLTSPPQTLERNSNLWKTSPISQLLLDNSKVNADKSPHPVIKEIRHVNEYLATSEFRSPKRTRLCAETDLLISSKLIPLHSSSFFLPKPNKKSPKRNLGDKIKKTLTQPNPNESILDDALRISKKSINSVSKGDEEAGVQGDAKIDHDLKVVPCQDILAKLDQPQKSKPFVQPTPKIDSTKSLHVPKNSATSPIEFESFKFNNKSTSISSVKASEKLIKNSSSSVQDKTQVSCVTQYENSGLEAYTTRSFVTPLQRISILANNRNKPPIKPSQTSNYYSNINSSLNSSPEESKLKLHRFVEPLSIRLPTLDDMKNIFHSTSTGSEDLIINDSEEEPLTPIGIEKTFYCFT
ncbi:Exodeoxyribonuclease 1 [Erysiphe necator]|nr:Exodeoxyribonuclease 1 [Erysiphe necator]